jgi:ubiquinone/menaquinone biosynthesis C-methylase UbiE
MTNLHKQTRDIYQAQHERISNDPAAFQRNLSMYNPETFGVDEAWFKGKEVLDAGCGNVGAVLIRFAELGAKKLYGCDVGSDFIAKLTENMLRAGIDESRFELKSGSVTTLPYEDNRFDYVSINGVLIHLADMEEIEKGFAEGARVTKPGGYYYTSYGPCGGVMQGVIFPALRSHYRANADFRALIDNLSPTLAHNIIDRICETSVKHGGGDLNAPFLKSLFGEDFCMFLHNFIQAPTWYSNECTPEYVENLYRNHGFKNVRRLSRFVKRQDIRKYFAPIHFDREWDFSKTMYGEGVPIYIGQKA